MVRPLGDALAISTMVYADEVIDPASLEGLPGEDVEVSDKELAMATQLIESLATEWEPERYRDEYREQVLEMIEAKAEGQEIVTVPDDEKEAGDVVDMRLNDGIHLTTDGGRLLATFDAEHTAQTPSEIARRADLPASTAHRWRRGGWGCRRGWATTASRATSSSRCARPSV